MSQPLYKSVDPETYLELAEELSSKAQAVEKRTAADRAYYAAFLVSRDLLSEKGYITPYYNSDDHRYVEETLKRRDILGSLGNDENRLRRARNVATYDTRDITTRTQQYARPLDWMLNTAGTIIDKVKKLPPRST
jgi:uncharacterized protein (UPF0332 family)